MPAEGRGLSSRPIAGRGRQPGDWRKPVNSPVMGRDASEAMPHRRVPAYVHDGVGTRRSNRPCPRAGCGKSACPVRRAGCGNGAGSSISATAPHLDSTCPPRCVSRPSFLVGSAGRLRLGRVGPARSRGGRRRGGRAGSARAGLRRAEPGGTAGRAGRPSWGSRGIACPDRAPALDLPVHRGPGPRIIPEEEATGKSGPSRGRPTEGIR